MGLLIATPDCNAHLERPIEAVHVGDRVLSADSKDQKSDTAVDPKTWKVVALEMHVPGDVVHIQLLRSPDWLKQNPSIPGTQVWMEWKEIDLEGMATVLKVEPLNHLASGNGRVVTATINHNTSVYKLSLTHGEPIEATGVHLIYSVTRHQWVHTKDLKIGEQLHSRDDQFNLTVTDLQKESGHKQVYNLEVEEDHHFYVGSEKLLVHNTDYDAGESADNGITYHTTDSGETISSEDLDALGLQVTDTGYYRALFMSGKLYSGKGGLGRAWESADEKSFLYDDPIVAVDHQPVPTEREAFKEEANNIDISGGPKSDLNYNKINSPGQKLNEEDAEGAGD